MERLTRRDEFLNADIVTDALNRLAAYEDTGLTPEEVCQLSIDCDVYRRDFEAAKKLAEEAQAELARYKELEADGRLVTLPCKVGDTVYVIDKCENVQMSRDDDYFTGTGAVECPFESTCDTEDCDDNHVRIFETVVTDFCHDDAEVFLENIGVGYTRRDIGKTIFLTPEEAEAALKAQEEGK